IGLFRKCKSQMQKITLGGWFKERRSKFNVTILHDCNLGTSTCDRRDDRLLIPPLHLDAAAGARGVLCRPVAVDCASRMASLPRGHKDPLPQGRTAADACRRHPRID